MRSRSTISGVTLVETGTSRPSVSQLMPWWTEKIRSERGNRLSAPSTYDAKSRADVELFTPELEASRDFFVDQMALREVHRDDGSVYLHAWDDYQSYTIRLIERDDAGIGRTFLRAASPQALESLIERIEATGLGRGYSTEEFGLGRVYLFDDPDGHPMGVYWDVAWYEPDDSDRPALKNQAAAFPGRGANVRRLDHVNYLSKEIDPLDRFLNAGRPPAGELRRARRRGGGGMRVSAFSRPP